MKNMLRDFRYGLRQLRLNPGFAIVAIGDEPLDISRTGEVRTANGLWVSGNFFQALGVPPALGRVFTAADDRRGCGFAPGAVVSYGFWQREFGGDPSAIGRTIAIGRNKVAVTGVTPGTVLRFGSGAEFRHRAANLLGTGPSWIKWSPRFQYHLVADRNGTPETGIDDEASCVNVAGRFRRNIRGNSSR